MNNEIKLAHFYTGFMITPMLIQDIKSIQKMNTVHLKYLRTGKIIYQFEIFNILSGLNNSLDVRAAKDAILFYIDEGNRADISKIMEKIR